MLPTFCSAGTLQLILCLQDFFIYFLFFGCSMWLPQQLINLNPPLHPLLCVQVHNLTRINPKMHCSAGVKPAGVPHSAVEEHLRLIFPALLRISYTSLHERYVVPGLCYALDTHLKLNCQCTVAPWCTGMSQCSSYSHSIDFIIDFCLWKGPESRSLWSGDSGAALQELGETPL